MIKNEFEEFRTGLSAMYAFYEKPINEFALDIWWDTLKIYDLSAITHAFRTHVKTPDTGRWLPKPADIVKIIDGSLQDTAVLAWSKVDRALREKGTYVDIVFDDPIIHRVIHDMGGWIGFGTKNDDDWPFVAKEFENRYRGYRERGNAIEYPGVLIGIASAYNNVNGYKSDQIVLIGDIEKCKKVHKKGGSGSILKITEIKDLKELGEFKMINDKSSDDKLANNVDHKTNSDSNDYDKTRLSLELLD